jgi:hypothetical protein
VLGYATATSGDTYGAKGQSDSTAGVGVLGYATAPSGDTWGVRGIADSTDGVGVYGRAKAASGTTYGVLGRSDSPGGWGVYSIGDMGATGSKSALVPTEDYGWRKLYAVESSGNYFEDFGEGQLVDGQASVAIDPIFAQTVNLSETYHTFLTPVGDEPVLLFVTQKTSVGFTVRGVTLEGQPASGAFDYRVVAKRLGYEDQRLEPAQDPNRMAVDAQQEKSQE